MKNLFKKKTKVELTNEEVFGDYAEFVTSLGFDVNKDRLDVLIAMLKLDISLGEGTKQHESLLKELNEESHLLEDSMAFMRKSMFKLFHTTESLSHKAKVKLTSSEFVEKYDNHSTASKEEIVKEEEPTVIDYKIEVIDNNSATN